MHTNLISHFFVVVVIIASWSTVLEFNLDLQ